MTLLGKERGGLPQGWRVVPVGRYTVKLFYICSSSASRTSMCVPKMGDKRNWSIAIGKWVPEKGQLTPRIDVSANRNGKVGGKCEWKMAMAEGRRLTRFWIQNVVSQASPSCYALARLALRARGLGFTLVARASPSRLALRACGSGFALAASTDALTSMSSVDSFEK